MTSRRAGPRSELQTASSPRDSAAPPVQRLDFVVQVIEHVASRGRILRIPPQALFEFRDPPRICVELPSPIQGGPQMGRGAEGGAAAGRRSSALGRRSSVLCPLAIRLAWTPAHARRVTARCWCYWSREGERWLGAGPRCAFRAAGDRSGAASADPSSESMATGGAATQPASAPDPPS